MKSADPHAELLTVSAAAARLMLGRDSVYLLIRQGRLRAVKLRLNVRSQWMVRASDLAAFVKGLPDVAA